MIYPIPVITCNQVTNLIALISFCFSLCFSLSLTHTHTFTWQIKRHTCLLFPISSLLNYTIFFPFVSESERNINMNKEHGVMLVGKTEIDTRAPFRSVKEAVSLFGEKVLAGEVYANASKLKQIHSGANENGLESSRIGEVAAELEETRENLQRAREESMLMAHCLSSLQEELERTKQELQQLKQRETKKHPVESEIEDVKFVENLTTFEIKSSRFDEEKMEFQKKRYVTFANPPSVSHVMLPQGVEKLERHPSLRKKKKKSLIPLIGGIFSRKKGSQEVP